MAQESKTKVVIRKLPPYLKQDGFLDAVNKGFGDSYDWFSYYPGKLSHRRLVHSRAYINFKHPEQVYDFHESFNGHIFVNEKGVQFRAEVEYAPYQKIPKGRNKKDLREGTIFEDPDYLAFLDGLEHPKRSTTVSDAQKEETEKAASKGPIITPLIQYIRDKRASKAAAGREKVGPRTSSRDALRKGPPASVAGAASGRNGKGSSSDKGILDRRAPGNKDAAPRKASTKSDGRARREASSASESARAEGSSKRVSHPSSRDSTGILKRPPTPASESLSPDDRRKEAPSRGGLEKRIVKGALASIIGGGLGRPPRCSGSSDARKETDEEGQETRDSGSRGSGPQARRLQRSAVEQHSLALEASGWGDSADANATMADGAGGGAADWGSENPLAADEAKAPRAPPSSRKEGSSRRGPSKSRSAAGRKEGDPVVATGWDDVSEGLLGEGGAEGSNPGAQGRGPSSVSGKQSPGGTTVRPQVKIMQRNQARNNLTAGSQTTGESLSNVNSGRSGESLVNKLDRLIVPESAPKPKSSPRQTYRSTGRGQELGSGQAVGGGGDEGVGRGGGRNGRRRAQGRGQNHEVDPSTSAAAAAAWAALSGAAPGTPPSSHGRPSDGASSQVRIMQRTGPNGAVPPGQSTAPASTAAGSVGSPSGAGEIPRQQQQSGGLGRGQARPGRQPRHQGPYQPGSGGRGLTRGGRTGSQTQGEGGEGASGAPPGEPLNRGPGGNESEIGRKAGGKEYGNAPTIGGTAEAAAAKKQMWMAVQKPG